jgi:hypothetical protein
MVFLMSGSTIAFFKNWGKQPSDRIRLIMWVIGVMRMSINSNTMKQGHLSIVHDFCGEDFINFMTSASITGL